MNLNFISQVLKITLLLAIICSIGLGLYSSTWDGIALFIGAIWGCVNLYLIQLLVQHALFFEQKNAFKLLIILGLKFPLLYITAGLLLYLVAIPPISFLLGFSLLFIAIFANFLRLIVQKKATLLVLSIAFTGALEASEAKTPEVPNIFTIIHNLFGEYEWAALLVQWETILFSIIISIALSLIFYFGTRKSTLIPSAFQNFLEWLIENLRKYILEILGHDGEKYVPFLGTLFIFILSMNWFGLIPLMKPPSSNINVTAALAICVFCLVQYLNIKHMGFFGFLYHMAGSPKDFAGWAMSPLMFPIEILTQLTRPVTLSLRLFGNIFGEDVLIGAFAMFGVALLSFIDFPVGLPLQIPFLFLALFTGLLQALVFTILSTIYILLSVPTEEHENIV